MSRTGSVGGQWAGDEEEDAETETARVAVLGPDSCCPLERGYFWVLWDLGASKLLS